jgi:hypothetical protein
MAFKDKISLRSKTINNVPIGKISNIKFLGCILLCYENLGLKNTNSKYINEVLERPCQIK